MVHRFIPRQSHLTNIRRRLFDFDRSESPKVVLQSLGGSGKTQLALECCWHAEENLAFMATLWIDASSPMSVVESYKTIASCLSKSLPDDNDGEATISAVKSILRNWKQRWLVVFDNYDNPLVFRTHPVNHYIPVGTYGSILFTSRHQDSRRLGH
jgi:NB-ARC domain